MERKENNRRIKALLALVLVMSLILPVCVGAATTSRPNNGKKENLIKEEMIGRYRFNYTGNTSYNQYWLADQSGRFTVKKYASDTVNNAADSTKKAAAKALGFGTDTKKITNSSTAELSRPSSEPSIQKAFLIWQTRSGSNSAIALVAGDGTAKKITPAASYVDKRECWNEEKRAYDWSYSCLYCHYADVTDFVQKKGYRKYAVCNIPVWNPTGTEGGESVAAWELVVVEEEDSYPVRSLMLCMASIFNQDQNLNSQDVRQKLDFKNIRTPSQTGTAAIRGQVFYMASVSTVEEGNLTASVYFENSRPKGDEIKKIDKSSKGGMIKDNSLIGTKNTCIRGSLEDFKVTFGFHKAQATLELSSQRWMSFFLFGLAVDVAQPDMTSSQTTTVNSSSSVTVTGNVKNISEQPNTGFLNGNLIVTLDEALTAASAKLTCYDAHEKKETTVSGSTGSNIVTFSDARITGKAKNSRMEYTIQCTVKGTPQSGKFQNKHVLEGKLFSKAVETAVNIHLTKAKSSAAPMNTPAPDKNTETKPNPPTETKPNPPTETTPEEVKKYNVSLYAGTGIESVSGAGTYEAGSTVNIGAAVKKGYHWKYWSGNFGASQGSIRTESGKYYAFSMPDHDVAATAYAEANTYTIRFDPNGGSGSIQEITAVYDQGVILPDGAKAYAKYTLDGNNVTSGVVSGAISQKMLFSEKGGEEEDKEEYKDKAKAKEELFAEEELKAAPGVADRTVYPSVFLGWALKEKKDDLSPQWKAGETVRNLTEEENGIVTLYAVWDDCPWIEAQDLYYSLEQAKSGFITEKELLSHAKATDREDGNPIAPGVNPAVKNASKWTSFTIPDYQAGEFTAMTGDAVISENLTVVDSAGSTYRKQIQVYVTDTAPREVKPKGTTRFINEYYYNQPEEYGGLPADSPWKTDSLYRSVIQEAFNNLKNDTPKMRFYFTHETILQMKKFIEEHGIGNSKEEDALQLFYHTFLEPNRVS